MRKSGENEASKDERWEAAGDGEPDKGADGWLWDASGAGEPRRREDDADGSAGVVKEGKTALAGEGEDGKVQLAEVGTAVER